MQKELKSGDGIVTKQKGYFKMAERDDYEELEMHNDFYKIYLEELEGIIPCSAEEEGVLLEAVLNGDKQAKKRLVEGFLRAAAVIAEEYKERGLAICDLVQEANVALLLMVEEFTGGDFRSLMEKRIREALEQAIDAQVTETTVEEEVTARVNVLKDISASMAEELGREATVEELAERMKMTVDEIKAIMKLTLDAMSVSGD